MGASAQWQWIDKDGRTVFSDRAPPQEIPEKNITRQPHQQIQPRRASQAAAGEANSAAAKPAAPSSAANDRAKASKSVDKELEKRLAKAEAEKAGNDKAEADKNASAKAENCTRAKQAKSTLDSGQLMKHVNAKGEQVYMDDAARDAERKRAQAVITSDCTP